MDEATQLRARTVVDNWLTVLVLVSLVAAGAGAVVTHGAHVEPGTHQEQRTVDEWSTRGSFTHAANVTDAARGTPFEPNTTVRNRAVYFQSIMPVLYGDFEFRTPGAETPVNVSIDHRLVVRSTESGDSAEGQTVYWSETRDFGRNQTVHSPDEPTTVPFQLNVTRTSMEAENVSERLGSTGEIQIQIRVVVLATRQVPDAQTRRLNYTLAIQDQSSVYRPQSEPTTQTFTETETVTVPNEPGQLRTVGGPVLLALGLVSAVGLSVGRWREWFDVTERERERLAYLEHRAEFDEWITTIELPEEAAVLPVARAETLADLVDFAIDTDSGVIEDPHMETYHVVHEGYRYTFEPPALPERDSVLASESNSTVPGGDRRPSETVDTEQSNGGDGTADGDESSPHSENGTKRSDESSDE